MQKRDVTALKVLKWALFIFCECSFITIYYIVEIYNLRVCFQLINNNKEYIEEGRLVKRGLYLKHINIKTVKFIRVDNMPFRTAWALTMCPIGRGKTLKKDIFVEF